MKSLEPSDDVAVAYGDLKEIEDTLETVYSYLLSQDLQQQYRSLSNKLQVSRLTSHVRDIHKRIETYIEQAQEDEDDVQE